MLYGSDPSSKEDDDIAAGMNRKNQEPISLSRTTPLCIAKLHSVHAHCPGFLQCRKDD